MDVECFLHHEGRSNVLLRMYDSENVVKKICKKFGNNRDFCFVHVDLKYLDKIMSFKEGLFFMKKLLEKFAMYTFKCFVFFIKRNFS